MSTPKEVTDPQLLAQLNSTEVTDPAILAQLNGNNDDVPRDKIISDAVDAVKSIGGAVVEGVPALIDEGLTHPGNTLKNIGAGLASIPINTGNAIANIPQYIAGLHSKSASDRLKRFVPENPSEFVINAIAGEPNEKEAAVRNLAALAPLLGPVGKGIRRVAIPASKTALKGAGYVSNKVTGGIFPGKTDAALEANEALLGKKIEDSESAFKEKSLAAAAAKEEHDAAVAQSQQALGKSNPNTMISDVGEHQEKIQAMTEEADQLKKQLLGSQPSDVELPEAEENLARSQEHVSSSENMAKKIDEDIGLHLNEGAQHDVKAARALSNRIQDIGDYWRDAYTTFESNIADSNFQMPKTAMDKIGYDRMTMDEFRQMNKMNQEKGKNVYLDSLKEVAPTSSDTSAADFLSKYKDFRDRKFELSQQIQDPRIEYVEKQKIKEAISKSNEMQSQMKEALDAGLGEFKPEFDRINKGYSDQVYPLRNNKYVENVNGNINQRPVVKLPDNIAKAFRTDEEGMGLLREIVKQDPELLRNVVGQRYFAKPSEIHNPNETMREYLNEMPDLNRLLSQKQKAADVLENAKSNAQVAKERHKEISARTEESAKTQKKVDEIQSAIENLQSLNDKMKLHIDDLQKKAANKKISLKDKMRVQAELKEAKKQLKENGLKLYQKTTGLKKLWGTAKIIYKGGKFMTTGRL